VWPGAGQVYLKRRALGFLLGVLNLAFFVGLIGAVLAGLVDAPADASWVKRVAHAVAWPPVVGLFALLGATWAVGVLDVVLRPPQEERRDSSHDTSVA
jgi:hypothetical protein